MINQQILKRIHKLSKLCEDTEPTNKELMYMDKLFTQDLIDVDKMYLQVKNNAYSRDAKEYIDKLQIKMGLD